MGNIRRVKGRLSHDIDFDFYGADNDVIKNHFPVNVMEIIVTYFNTTFLIIVCDLMGIRLYLECVDFILIEENILFTLKRFSLY